jgi:hypothetical protein
VAREDSVRGSRLVWGWSGARTSGTMEWFAPVGPRCLCGACEPVGQHGAEGCHGNRGLLPSSTSVRLLIFLPSPGRTPRVGGVGRELVVMDLVHPRCAGVDVSKRDAKVCVRVAGRGRAGAASKVTTRGSFTNQVLALREHLISEQVTLVVMEATGVIRGFQDRQQRIRSSTRRGHVRDRSSDDRARTHVRRRARAHRGNGQVSARQVSVVCPSRTPGSVAV